MSTCALGRAKAEFDNPISKPAAAIKMYLDVFIFVLPFFTFQPFCSPIQTLSTGLLLQTKLENKFPFNASLPSNVVIGGRLGVCI